MRRIPSHFYRTTMASGIALLLISSSGASQGPAIDTKSGDEQDIYAVVIRHQMEEWIREGDRNEAEAKTRSDASIARVLNFKIFFISISGKDPSDEFMNRFRDIPRTMRKASSVEHSKFVRSPVDKTTHLTGIIFDAEKLHWLDQGTAEVEGGYYCGGFCAAGFKFTVRRENRKWVVKDSVMQWIS